MAFYFARRKVKPQERDESSELNLVPYLDILMNLIIFMLMSITGLAAFGIVNVNSPGAATTEKIEETQQDKKQDFLLTVAISEKGFYVAATGGVLGQDPASGNAGSMEGAPSIPRLSDGSFNYKALTDQMIQIKSTQEFRKETKVILTADSQISYEVLVATMDAVREVPGKREILFPDVTLGAF